MDKQKDIEKIAFSICELHNAYESVISCEKCGYTGICRNQEYAEKFFKKGYGDVRAAVKEFAERVKMAFYYELDELIPSIMADKIDELVKEVCGNE